MNQQSSAHALASNLPGSGPSMLTGLAQRVTGWNLPFAVMSTGMIVMLLWAGSYKMTAPGAEGIIPLVSHSPLISWHFKEFGPYVGSDLIGATEWTAALLVSPGAQACRVGLSRSRTIETAWSSDRILAGDTSLQPLLHKLNFKTHAGCDNSCSGSSGRLTETPPPDVLNLTCSSEPSRVIALIPATFLS